MKFILLYLSLLAGTYYEKKKCFKVFNLYNIETKSNAENMYDV